MWRQVASGAWLTRQRLYVYAGMLIAASLISAVVWIALRFLTENIFLAKALAVPPAAVLAFVLMRRFVFRGN